MKQAYYVTYFNVTENGDWGFGSARVFLNNEINLFEYVELVKKNIAESIGTDKVTILNWKEIKDKQKFAKNN